MTHDDRTTLEFENGFVLVVQTLPPYYLDIIKDGLPHKDYPKRLIKNIAGDVLELDYQLPETEPSGDDAEERDLWLAWQSVDQFNRDTDEKRLRARMDFLLAVCVEIESGPISIEDEDWVDEVEAAFAHTTRWRVPHHPGARKVVFLKSKVLTNEDYVNEVLGNTVYPEVSEQGIVNALRNF